MEGDSLFTNGSEKLNWRENKTKQNNKTKTKGGLEGKQNKGMKLVGKGGGGEEAGERTGGRTKERTKKGTKRCSCCSYCILDINICRWLQ